MSRGCNCYLIPTAMFSPPLPCSGCSSTFTEESPSFFKRFQSAHSKVLRIEISHSLFETGWEFGKQKRKTWRARTRKTLIHCYHRRFWKTKFHSRLRRRLGNQENASPFLPRFLSEACDLVFVPCFEQLILPINSPEKEEKGKVSQPISWQVLSIQGRLIAKRD